MNYADIAELARWLTVWVFALSAINKLRHFAGFVETIQLSIGLSALTAKTTSVALIILETCVVLGLFAGPDIQQLAMASAVLMLLSFTGYLAYGLLQGKAVYCQCFSAQRQPVTAWDIARNSGYLLASVIFLLTPLVAPALSQPMPSLTSQMLFALTALPLFIASTQMRQIQQLWH